MNGKQHRFCSFCGSYQDRYYSVKTVATMLDCSVETIRGWIKEGSIKTVKAHGLRRIPAKSLNHIIIEVPSIKDIIDGINN
ncbi:helix-turn-helix domain-containing protein [Candidatus Neomarinimicrobiota bacterium]